MLIVLYAERELKTGSIFYLNIPYLKMCRIIMGRCFIRNQKFRCGRKSFRSEEHTSELQSLRTGGSDDLVFLGPGNRRVYILTAMRGLMSVMDINI